MASTAAVSGTGHPAPLESEAGLPIHKNSLARKLTCSVVTIIVFGECLIFLIQAVLVLGSVSGWGEDTKKAMIKLETENLQKLASDKAEYVGEVFGRLEEAVQQLQAFAQQALFLEWPDAGAGVSTMTLGDDQEYLQSYPGLEQRVDSWYHSVW